MRRQLLAVALAALIPFALLAVWARLDPVAPWELEVLLMLALAPGPYGDVVRGINLLGDLWLWVILVAALSALALSLRRAWQAVLIALTVVADLVGSGVKLVVERARPEGAFIEGILGDETFAFPSGHVVRATALAAVLAWMVTPRRLKLPLALVAGVGAGTLMGYARISLGVHWPSDVLGGLLLGLGWFAATALIVENRIH